MKKANWLLAALIAFPAASFARTVTESCPANGAPTAQSYTWSFSREATNLLNDVRNDAMKVRNQSGQLDTFVAHPDLIGWRPDSDKLIRIRSEVNDIGSKLCRLEAIRGSVMPWQKTAIDRTVADSRELALNTTDAIHFLNAHQDFPWSPAYEKTAENISRQSKDLADFLGNSERLAKLHDKELRMDKRQAS